MTAGYRKEKCSWNSLLKYYDNKGNLVENNRLKTLFGRGEGTKLEKLWHLIKFANLLEHRGTDW